MEDRIVTEVRINLASAGRQDGIRGWARVVLAGLFVVKDILITDNGERLTVNMPSQRHLDHCPHCHRKNILQACYCQYCGAKLDPERARFMCGACRADNFAGSPRCGDCGEKLLDARNVLFEEVCHPITRRCRAAIEEAVLSEYQSLKGDPS